jgi:hypothetical protein
LSVGWGVIVIFSCGAHLTTSAPFRARSPGSVSGRLSPTASWRTGIWSWFPAAFRLPALASWSSCARRGIGPSLRSACRTSRSGPRRGYRVPHTQDVTGVGALCTPRTVVLIPDRSDSATGTRRIFSGQSLFPAMIPTGLGAPSRGINEGSSNSPVRSSPHLRPLGWNEQPLGLFPGLRTPPAKSRTTHAKEGTGHQSTDPELPLNSHPSISNPVVHLWCATSRRTSQRRRPQPAVTSVKRKCGARDLSIRLLLPERSLDELAGVGHPGESSSGREALVIASRC